MCHTLTGRWRELGHGAKAANAHDLTHTFDSRTQSNTEKRREQIHKENKDTSPAIAILRLVRGNAYAK